jgi:hypothetical protein
VLADEREQRAHVAGLEHFSRGLRCRRLKKAI